MRVVAATMRDACCVAFVVNGCNRRRIRQACIFSHWKRVHIGAREYGLSFTIAKNANHSGAADPFDDFVAEVLEFGRDECGSFRFLKTRSGERSAGKEG